VRKVVKSKDLSRIHAVSVAARQQDFGEIKGLKSWGERLGMPNVDSQPV
jgi:hypothetical protein